MSFYKNNIGIDYLVTHTDDYYHKDKYDQDPIGKDCDMYKQKLRFDECTFSNRFTCKNCAS